jgi:hypothetical protein
MTWSWRNLKNSLLRFVSPRPSGGLDQEALKQMAREIAMTQPGEIGCDECFEQMDRFVEIELAGKNAAEAMPLVQDHLERCVACREEYEALLLALRAVA